MRVTLERSHWRDALVFGFGVYWTDWSLRQLRFEVEIGRWVFALIIKLRKEVEP